MALRSRHFANWSRIPFVSSIRIKCVVGAALLADTTIRTTYVPAGKDVRSPTNVILVFVILSAVLLVNVGAFPKRNLNHHHRFAFARVTESKAVNPPEVDY